MIGRDYMVYSAVSDDIGTVSQFTRRKEIKLSHVGALTAYQKELDIDYEPAMQTNFDDIRFVTEAGVHIPYWIESKTDSSTADVWVKNDYVDGDTYIWMYYGNSGLSSGSNITDTMIFGDDFPGSSIDTGKWEGDTGYASVSGGIMTFSPDGSDRKLNSIVNISPDIIYESRSSINSGSWSSWGFQIDPFASPYPRILGYRDTVNNWLVSSDTSTAEVSTNWTMGVYNVKKIIWSDSDNSVSWYEDDVEKTNSPYTTGANIPDESLSVIAARGSTQVHLVDWVFIRKYAATEPTVVIGIEQHQRRIAQIL